MNSLLKEYLEPGDMVTIKYPLRRTLIHSEHLSTEEQIVQVCDATNAS